jgi:hypothetical protein
VHTTARPSLLVSADGRGVVSRAGWRLLADLAGRTTLTAKLSAELAVLARPEQCMTMSGLKTWDMASELCLYAAGWYSLRRAAEDGSGCDRSGW